MLLALLPLLLTPTPEDGDHFATWIAPLGDVDADGVPDFAVSDHYEASNEHEGAGWIGLVSGKDQRLLWELRGAAQGAHLGAWLQPAGDVNGDGTSDLAHATDRGREAEVRCGRTGEALLSFPGRHVVPAGDVNGDGRGDLLVGVGQPEKGAEAPHVVGRVRSGADGGVLLELRFEDLLRGARPVQVGDVDGDGRADWGLHKDKRLVLYRSPDGARLTPASPWWLAHCSGRAWVATDADGSITLHVNGVARRLRGPSSIVRPTTSLLELGDADGDGVADLLLTLDGFAASSGARSGATGEPLWRIEDHPRLLHDLTATVVGDLDGDGVRDVLAGFHWAMGGEPIRGWVQAHSGKDGALLFRVTRADLSVGR